MQVDAQLAILATYKFRCILKLVLTSLYYITQIRHRQSERESKMGRDRDRESDTAQLLFNTFLECFSCCL